MFGKAKPPSCFGLCRADFEILGVLPAQIKDDIIASSDLKNDLGKEKKQRKKKREGLKEKKEVR